MKNIFRFWMAVAIICGTVSCAKEDISSSLAGGEVEVTFTANLPELGTRAYGDGANANLLRYWVYDAANGNLLEDLSDQEPGSGTFTFTLPLIKGMTYDFVLWADKDGLYNVNDEGIVTVDYANANNNDRDAFYGFVKGFDPLKSTPKFTLIRPFAQLNAATSENMEDIEANGLTLATSSIKIKAEYYTKFDIKSRDVLEASKTYGEFVLAADDMPYLTKDAEGNINKLPGKENYSYLAMGYVLAPAGGMVADVTFYFNGTKNGADFTVGGNEGLSYGNVPLKQNFRTNILGQLLTKSTEITVEIEKDFGKPSENIVPVATTAELQKAVDEAVANTTIRLEPGVNYGTILIRPVEGAANTISGCDYLIYRNEMLRNVENLTIVGAKDATVEAFKVVAGYIEGSTAYVVDIKNLVIDGVEFTDKFSNPPYTYAAPIFINTSYTNLDGLTVKNCKLIGNNPKMNFVYFYGSGNPSNSTFETAAKNVTITNNTVEGIARLCELRQTENVTITNNTIKNTALHAILLPVDNGTYSGNVTITNNTAESINERFVRMAGAGNAVVVIKDNVIVNYQGTDADYIKVTDGTNVTDENNISITGPTDTYDNFLKALSDDTWYVDNQTELIIEDVADYAAFTEIANSGNDFAGKTIKLANDINLYFKDITDMADSDPTTFRPIGDTKYNGGKPFKGTFDGQGHTIRNLYQNGWDLGYEWGVYGSYGLFGSLEDATVKNVVIEGSESYIEGGDVSFIAGSAEGNCVFENITINSGVAATYNNGCGGIIGWSGAGTYTFKNITIGEDAVLGGLWGSFDSSIGGIVGQAEPGATYNFENVTINCRIDAYNDCTASYDYYNYRMCGMIIGRCEETTTIDGKNYPDLSKYNLSFNNVVVNYGDWMNYHYCEPTPGHNGGRGMRVEPGYAYDGLPADYDHSQCVDSHMNWLPFNQLIGGDQIAVKGLPAVEGVTVNYPESFYLEQGYKAEGNTYSIYTGEGFKTIATTVLADGTKNVTIELANDIDLAGIEWPAVTTAAAFVLDGKGYAIKNLTTSAVEDHGFYSTAMFTSTRKATTIKNLVVENATVTGKGVGNSHGAVLVACNYAALNIEGVTVKDSTVSNCDRSSVIATYLYFTSATVKNCVVEGCTVNSIGTAGALLGINNSNDFVATGNTVKNTTISSSEGSNKAGILIGTWQNAGTLTENDNVVENSKAINAGTETNNNIGRRS